MSLPFLPLIKKALLAFVCAAGVAVPAHVIAESAQKPAQKALLEQPTVDADAATWFRWHEQEAKRGDLTALTKLGVSYCDGNGVKQDMARGQEILLEAATKGSAIGQLWLGRIYRDGSCGVTEDRTAAIDWMGKAAQQGDAESQYSLARMYHHGDGSPEDAQQAFHWYEKAVEQNHLDAKTALAALLISNKNVPTDHIRVHSLLTENVAQNDLIGQVYLGLAYKSGWLRDGDLALTPKSKVAAYALFSARQDPVVNEVEVELANRELEKLEKTMSPLEQWAGKQLAAKMLKTGHTLKALDAYMEYERPYLERKPLKPTDLAQLAQAVASEVVQRESTADAIAVLKSKFGNKPTQTSNDDRPGDDLAAPVVRSFAEGSRLPSVEIVNFQRDNGWLVSQAPPTYRVEYTYRFVLTKHFTEAVVELAESFIQEGLQNSPDDFGGYFRNVEWTATNWKERLGDSFDYRFLAFNANCRSCADYWFKERPEQVTPHLENILLFSWMKYLDLDFRDHSSAGDTVPRLAWQLFIKKEKGWDPA